MISTIVVMGLIMLSIVLGISFFSFFQSQNTFNARSLLAAKLAAESGLADGTLRVIFNKNCPDTNCVSPYQLSIGSATTTISLCKDACDGIGKTRVTSVGIFGQSIFELQAILDVNSVTGEVQIISKNEP